MRMIFSGVGEAFDETLPNTSILLEGTDGESLLLDCGFTAASAFWSVASRPLDLGAVCLSHF
ncbi:MAG: ribonuclease Z, partial [Desulfovibrio sp.]|nr:ribonuclease Z [Desulfovibrio sp.]